MELPYLAGEGIVSVYRLGKFIVFELTTGYVISHLRMTGQWRYTNSLFDLDVHDRGFFRLGFGSGDQGFLIFSDVRKFGTLEHVNLLTEHDGYCSLGPDGLDINDNQAREKIIARAKKTRKPIKNFLLDQTVIAGVGNIYACSVLWECGINPKTPTNQCVEDIPRICEVLVDIFKAAIEKRGSSISDFKGGTYHKELKVYGREGLNCFRCSAKIERIVQAGRSTFYCPQCQG